MRALLVQPEFPVTYWGFQHGLPLAGRKVSLPPLGLLTLAALLPEDWELRLVDLNAEPLLEEDLAWAEVVLTGGMRVQADSIHEVVARARAAGRKVAVGGPAPTTDPAPYAAADVVFQGEAEGRIEALLAALEGRGPRLLEAPLDRKPDVTSVPVPRYDLLDLGHYASMSMQLSRGCPYSCEFCDIIEIFGRVPRVKSGSQALSELDTLRRLGWVGSVFVVDDNFIGNRRAVKALLPELSRWQGAHGYPFELYTEASVNLAADDDLMDAMVRAGFSSVFLGIETPSPEALAGAHKTQNLKLELHEAVDVLCRRGLEVMGGFIVGFDEDDPGACERQWAFIADSPIPLAMVGLLTALPGTALWRRLEGEGRLRGDSSGDQFGRPNFDPAMDEATLLSGYARLMGRLYTVDAYYDRCERFVERAAPLPGRRPVRVRDLLTLVRTTLRVGLGSRAWRRYWRLMWRTVTRARHALPWAVAHAVMGEHMIRYTREDVLPRIEAAARATAQAVTARSGTPRLAPSPDAADRPGPPPAWREAAR